MPFYALSNLSSGDTVALSLEQLTGRQAAPHSSFSSKGEYRAWCADHSSEGTFYSLVEGSVPSQRVTKANVPARIHGLVADYDVMLHDGMIEHAFDKCPADLQPVAMSRTFSGGARVIWLFETPLNVFDKDAVTEVIKRLFKLVKAKAIFAGLDDGAINDYFAQYFELGLDWVQLNPDARISASTVGLQIAEVVGNPKVDLGGVVDIPIQDVANEVTQRFPGKWSGDFVVGARGPRFWDSSASNSAAAIVREGGMAFFTDGGGFLPWSAVLGNDFVRKYREKSRGAVITDVWYDGQCYYAPGPDGHGWIDYGVGPIQRYLQKRGVSSRPPKGEEMSELERALGTIEEVKRVKGIAPFIHRHDRIVKFQGDTYLNVATAKCHDMHLDPCQWGEHFPWIASYLEGLFADEDQMHRFLAWMRRFYKNGYDGTPKKGQALFVFGGPKTGKTLLSTRIIGPMVGGSQPATSYLMGEEKFTGALFKSPTVTVDDALASTDPHLRMRYSNKLKELVANPFIEYREMYHSPVTVEWLGRPVVTGNTDPVSLRMLPSRELSNSDKQMILRVKEREGEFPEDVEAIIARELGAFCRFVYDYTPRPEHVGDARFGTRPFCDPVLDAEIADSSTSASIHELLLKWRAQYAETHPGEDVWEGTATDLLESLADMSDGRSKILEGVTREKLGARLAQLKSEDKNPWIESKRSSRGRLYTLQLK